MELNPISPSSHTDMSRPACQLIALQQLLYGIGSSLDLSATDRQLLRQLSLSQAQAVCANLQRISDKWQRSLPSAQYLDVKWQEWGTYFHDLALASYADDVELCSVLVTISQTLSQIEASVTHPSTQSLQDLYQKYLDHNLKTLAAPLRELDDWVAHTLPRKRQLRDKRLHERSEALRRELVSSGFLAFATDGAGQPLPPDEALEELMPDAVADSQLVADYIYRNHCQISREQIRCFFKYVIFTARIDQELNPQTPPTAEAPSLLGGQGESLDPHHILRPDADPQLVLECVRQADALIGEYQYKYAHLLKVMLDHHLLSITQSDHDPFARTLEHWGCTHGKQSVLIKGSIRQRLKKMMDARHLTAGQVLPLYRTWPDTDPDRQICLQLATIFTQAGFEYPRVAQAAQAPL